MFWPLQFRNQRSFSLLVETASVLLGFGKEHLPQTLGDIFIHKQPKLLATKEHNMLYVQVIQSRMDSIKFLLLFIFYKAHELLFYYGKQGYYQI